MILILFLAKKNRKYHLTICLIRSLVCLFTEQFYLLKNVKYQPELRTVLKVDLVPAAAAELLLQSTEQTSQFVPLKGPTRVLFCNSIEINATNLSKWFNKTFFG